MRINEITVADHPDAWQAAGFTVEDDRVTIGRSFVIRLTGRTENGPQSGVVSWTVGIEGRSDDAWLSPGGLDLRVAAPAAPAPGEPHDNGVLTCMKAVILTSDTQTSIDRLKREVSEFGEPPINGHDPKGIHYAIWPLDDTEVGLEVVSLDPEQGDDAMAAIFLVVDNLKATIKCIGENDVTPVEVYGGRNMVRIKPRIGVTPGICLIAGAK
jgi:hypothetical protein